MKEHGTTEGYLLHHYSGIMRQTWSREYLIYYPKTEPLQCRDFFKDEVWTHEVIDTVVTRTRRASSSESFK
mgnify:CR=1 FL=1